MAVIASDPLNALLDGLCKAYRLELGTADAGLNPNGYGLAEPGGAFGAGAAIVAMTTALAQVDDLDPSVDLGRSLQFLALQSSSLSRFIDWAKPLLQDLDSHARKFGGVNYKDLDSYLKYLNTGTGTHWQSLMNPVWRTLFMAWKSGVAPNPENIYMEVLQGATYPTALGKLVVGGPPFAAGFAIDNSVSVGGFPQLRVSGLTGTGVVTVTGPAYNPNAHVVDAARTWTATVVANGVIALAPGGGSAAVADSLLASSSTGIVAAGGISAGTIHVETVRPTTGRLAIP